mmetsp:Transcript_9677/g.14507  ORF Transcript_9677/g.14507 Transcript_9677/m.14507 type:complete len:88 (+) Transcript_9677:229-492(+)
MRARRIKGRWSTILTLIQLMKMLHQVILGIRSGGKGPTSSFAASVSNAVLSAYWNTAIHRHLNPIFIVSCYYPKSSTFFSNISSCEL